MSINKGNITPWLICFSGALFFFYQFLQVFRVLSEENSRWSSSSLVTAYVLTTSSSSTIENTAMLLDSVQPAECLFKASPSRLYFAPLHVSEAPINQSALAWGHRPAPHSVCLSLVEL